MASRRAPWSERLLEILSDGEWHDYERTVLDCMVLVDRGRAYKKSEEARKRQQERRGQAPTARVRGDAIASGQRSIFVDSLQQYIRNGHVQKEGVRLRLNPDRAPRKKESVAFSLDGYRSLSTVDRVSLDSWLTANGLLKAGILAFSCTEDEMDALCLTSPPRYDHEKEEIITEKKRFTLSIPLPSHLIKAISATAE